MYIGYARVSTAEQNLERQIDELEKAGCEKIYHEKTTGTTTERIELNNLIEFLRSGDIVVVSELTRLSRSTKDLFSVVDKIHSKGADIVSLKEKWLDTTTPQGKLMFTIFAGLSQFERDIISERTKEGLRAAKARGRSGGRPSKQNEKKLSVEILYNNGVRVVDIAKQTNLSRSTVNRILKGITTEK